MEEDANLAKSASELPAAAAATKSTQRSEVEEEEEDEASGKGPNQRAFIAEAFQGGEKAGEETSSSVLEQGRPWVFRGDPELTSA
jgi:hypothetical protein